MSTCRAQGPQRGPAGVKGGRCGALLLEVLIALAIFIAAGTAVLVLVGRSVDGLARAREATRAADLARSAMARIEAGIETPQALNGPVPLWSDDPSWRDGDESAGFAGFDDAPAVPSGWELEVRTVPSRFPGLTTVTVRAIRREGASRREGAAYELTQLVRLAPGSDALAAAGHDSGPGVRR